MAYSDYGGYGYRNGRRIEERSDACFTSEGLKSTCGEWPGWTIPEGRSGRSYHVILGDGPIFVCLYKSSFAIFLNGEEIDQFDYCLNDDAKYYVSDDRKYINTDIFKETGEKCSIKINDHLIEVYWREEDNFYQYVKLTQPDGTVWLGFSGYGVGAGLEDGAYGYRTTERIGVLSDLFTTEALI